PFVNPVNFIGAERPWTLGCRTPVDILHVNYGHARNTVSLCVRHEHRVAKERGEFYALNVLVARIVQATFETLGLQLKGSGKSLDLRFADFFVLSLPAGVGGIDIV